MPDDSRARQFSTEPQHHRIPQSTVFLDNIIELQFKDSIFLDPNFLRNFLPLATSPNNVVGLCLSYDWHLRVNNEWKFPHEIKDEQCLHQPVLHILNTIKSATDAVLSSPAHNEINTNPDLTTLNNLQYKDYHLPLSLKVQELSPPDGSAQYFEDWSTRDVPHALPEKIMCYLRPDIILFRGKWRHWANIRFIVEIMESPQHLATGIKQLACYAHAVFAHQFWRRHFYSLLICGKKASFVRFDRAGVVYSVFFRIATNPSFVIALATLLSLDAVDQGIDPAFQFAPDGLYINLRECMLDQDSYLTSAGGSDVRDAMKTRRFRIIQESCDPTSRHRVVGPGTSVFRIREHFPPGRDDEGEGASSRSGAGTRFDGSDGPARTRLPAEYILKLSWRLDNDRSEGQALAEARGIFGVPQLVSHGDIVMPGQCRCLLAPGAPVPQTQCTTCVDRTPVLLGLQAYSNFRDLSAKILSTNGGGLQVPNSARSERIHSYILSSSVGQLMEHAESPRTYVNAMIDAILGYWGLYNLGIIHQNISPHNLLMLTREQESTRTRWELTEHRVQDPVLADSERQLRQTLGRLGTGSPIGMLIDLSTHERLGYAKAALTPEVVGERRALPHNFLANGPPNKRRKGNSGGSVPTASIKAGRKRQIQIPAPTGDGPQPPFSSLICCNEKFHSIRVARMVMTPRLQYQHHFYDDLESFFWVMLWTIMSHVDPGKERSKSATTLLVNFYQADDKRRLHMVWKQRILNDCRIHGAADTMAVLEACKNSWADNRLLRMAIASFGYYIGTLREEQVVSPPAEVFSMVIMTLENVLKMGE